MRLRGFLSPAGGNGTCASAAVVSQQQGLPFGALCPRMACMTTTTAASFVGLPPKVPAAPLPFYVPSPPPSFFPPPPPPPPPPRPLAQAVHVQQQQQPTQHPMTSATPPLFSVTLMEQCPKLRTMPFAAIASCWSHVISTVAAAASSPAASTTSASPPVWMCPNDRERHALCSVLSMDFLGTCPTFTVAHWAAAYGLVNVLEYLVSKDPAEAATMFCTGDCKGNRPIHWTAKGGQLMTFRWLVEWHRNHPGDEGETDEGLPRVVTKPGEDGLDVALLAARFGHTGILDAIAEDPPLGRRLLTGRRDSSAKVSTRSKSVTLFADQPTAIALTAAQFNSVATLEWLLKHQIIGDVAQPQDRLGRGVATYLVEGGHFDTVKTWLPRHFPMSKWSHESARDPSGATLVHHAARSSRSVDLVRFLYEHCHIPIQCYDKEGWPPTVWCVKGGKSRSHIAILEYLRDAGGLTLSGGGVRQDGSGPTLAQICEEIHGGSSQMTLFLKGLEATSKMSIA